MSQPESFPICRGCGILASSHQAQCPRCQTATGEDARWVAYRTDGAVSAAVEMAFRCRACGHWAPANFLDLDGSLACGHCGIEQAFRPERFREVLVAAHDVADLAGPHSEGAPAHRGEPIGANNPYALLGQREVFHTASLEQHRDIDLEVRLRLTRGRPLCARCQTPVELGLDDQGALTTLCSECQDRAAYALPPGAAKLYPPLLGVAAEEHRSDRQRSGTITSDASGPVGIACPNCQAPLEVSTSSALTKCKFCAAQSVIPSRIWARATGQEPAIQLWYVLLRGPSEQRQRLTSRAREDRERQSRALQAAPATPGVAPPRRGDGPVKGAAYIPLEGGTPTRPRLGIALALAGVLAALVVIPIALIAGRSSEVGSTQDAPRSKPKTKTKTKAKAKAKPRRSTFDELTSCSCSTQVDGKTGLEQVGLAIRSDWASDKLQIQIYMDVEGRSPHYLPLGPKTAPPSMPGRSTIAIGMACEKHVVAVVSGQSASGWSAKTGKLLWSKTLSSRYDHPNPPQVGKGKFVTWCTSLRPVAGHMVVNFGAGKRQRIRIADGRITSR